METIVKQYFQTRFTSSSLRSEKGFVFYALRRADAAFCDAIVCFHTNSKLENEGETHSALSVFEKITRQGASEID